MKETRAKKRERCVAGGQQEGEGGVPQKKGEGKSEGFSDLNSAKKASPRIGPR